MTEIVKTTTVARINKVDILVIENGEKRVAIKPICQALGIDEEAQRQKLNSDPILSSTTLLSKVVAADGKEREMVTIPLKYVFGWLFRIDSRNVKEEAKEAVLKYQIECYDALFEYFNGYAEYVEKKQREIEDQLEIVDAAKTNFNSAKTLLYEADKQLKVWRRYSYADYKAESSQPKFFTDSEMKGEN